MMSKRCMAIVCFLMVSAAAIPADYAIAEEHPKPAEGGWSIECLIPNQTEVAIHFDVQRLRETGIVKQVLLERGKWDQVEAFADVMEAATGTNFLTGVDEVYVFGRINDEENAGLVVMGDLVPKKLINLARANPEYQTIRHDDQQTVHAWFDEKDKRMKYATFLGERTLAVWNSEGACRASLEARSDPSKRARLTDADKAMLGGADHAIIWGLMIPRDRETFDQMQVEAASVVCRHANDVIQMDMMIRMESPESARQMATFLQGLKSLGRLQEIDSRLNTIAQSACGETKGDYVKVRISAPVHMQK